MLTQWFLNFTNTTNPYVVFQAFVKPLLPNTTENKNGLLISDDLHQTPEAAPLNPGGSIEPSLRTTVSRCCRARVRQTSTFCYRIWIEQD